MNFYIINIYVYFPNKLRFQRSESGWSGGSSTGRVGSMFLKILRGQFSNSKIDFSLNDPL